MVVLNCMDLLLFCTSNAFFKCFCSCETSWNRIRHLYRSVENRFVSYYYYILKCNIILIICHTLPNIIIDCVFNIPVNAHTKAN